MRDAIRPGCGSKAGIALVLLILTIIVGVMIWASSENPTDTPNPAATGTPPTLEPA